MTDHAGTMSLAISKRPGTERTLRAFRFYQRWSPQPIQPFRDKLDLKKIKLAIPKSHLVCIETSARRCQNGHGTRVFLIYSGVLGLCRC